MTYLNDFELKEINGGFISLKIGLAIGAAVAFVLGFIDGFVRPLPCRK